MTNILNGWTDFWNKVGNFFANYGQELYNFWIAPKEGTPYIITLTFALVYLVLGYFLIKLISDKLAKS